jgi:transcriptional regulator with XRE-family HTH domain
MENLDSFYLGLGNLIRKERKGKEMNQDQLAKSANLNRVSIVNIENGKQRILLHTLVDIAQALGVTPEQLIPREGVNIDYSQIKKQLDTPEAHKLGKLFFDDDKSKEE